MRQLQAEKYNVAWFKLADFVVRGEKERALGVYRLLMHAVNDEALALQLEGDILLSFHDNNALDRYRAAAQAYRQGERFIQSLSMYEHINALKGSTFEDILAMIELSHIITVPSRLVELYTILLGYPQALDHKETIKTLLETSKKIVPSSVVSDLESLL